MDPVRLTLTGYVRFIQPDDGDNGIRTHDPLLAGQVLSQLSYTPKFQGSVRSLKTEQQRRRISFVSAKRRDLRYALIYINYGTDHFSIEHFCKY